MYEITTGKLLTAKKTVIYGVEGVGKTRFAAKMPGALFIDTEGSTGGYSDIRRLPAPSSWEMLLNEVAYVAQNPTICQTLVVDTADWAEKLCTKAVLDRNNWQSIEDAGYGAGYRHIYEEFGKLLNALTEVYDKGVNVTLTAHAYIRKFEQPDEMGAYDRWELKLQNTPKCSIAAMVKEWADMVLFANFKTYSVAADKDGKKFKAQGGKRVMYTEHNPCWDAKNRDDLPPEMDFDFSQIAHIFGEPVQKKSAENTAPKKVYTAPTITQPPEPAPMQPEAEEPPLNIPDNLPKALQDLMRSHGVDESDIRLAVSQKGYFPYDMPLNAYPPDFVQGCLIAAWEQVYAIIKDNQGVPF